MRLRGEPCADCRTVRRSQSRGHHVKAKSPDERRSSAEGGRCGTCVRIAGIKRPSQRTRTRRIGSRGTTQRDWRAIGRQSIKSAIGRLACSPRDSAISLAGHFQVDTRVKIQSNAGAEPRRVAPSVKGGHAWWPSQSAESNPAGNFICPLSARYAKRP